MRVFIVIAGRNFEGYSEPAAAYSTRELAEADLAKRESNFGEKWEIIEMDVDAGIA